MSFLGIRVDRARINRIKQFCEVLKMESNIKLREGITLVRTQPELPLPQGNPKRLTTTYKRNGTVNMIAFFPVHHGKVIAKKIKQKMLKIF